MSRPARPRVGFYCVADERYFLGAVAMINSLRLQGHADPVFVCDSGLSAGQRDLLAAHVTVVDAPARAPAHLLKTVAPLAHPAETMVLIDTDMIATRPLDDLIETAMRGALVAFENDVERFVPEWGELMGLGPARRRRYVSSGLVAVEGDLGAEVVGLMAANQGRVDFEQTFWRRNNADYPFLYGDQDLLNAVLATRVEGERVQVLAGRLSALPPFRGLRLRDQSSLRCAYRDGSEPYVLHHFGRKPWLEPIRHGLYSRAMARLLLGRDVAVKIPVGQVPLRMRSGPRARLERIRVDARDVASRYLRQPVARRG